MLGARIAALRRSAGWSQAELARRLQISASAIGMYEQGRREPSADTLVALSELFGVSTDYLLTGKTRSAPDAEARNAALRSSMEGAQCLLESRPRQPFTRDELSALLQAMLSEP